METKKTCPCFLALNSDWEKWNIFGADEGHNIKCYGCDRAVVNAVYTHFTHKVLAFLAVLVL